MAMLAEPRRKQKIINLRAKNNAWSNDSTKFGQRMLEKMGWKSGKGLGAKENGITEHVVARYKNDERGLGFEDKNDQWTKHEDDFNSLLANLSNASDNVENLHSRVSLEDKSKKSKARIHYHKFTRGKDISRYSEKDLANIFGKKSFKSTEVVEEISKDDLKTTEQVFTEKGSMEDYFKNKLAVIKSKSKIDISNVKENDWEDASYAFQGFSQESNEVKMNNDNFSCNDNLNLQNACHSQIIVKKKKSKKQCKEKLENMNENTYDTVSCQEHEDKIFEDVTKEKKKSKKKSKNKVENIHMIETEVSQNECWQTENVDETSQIVKKKKKSKNNNKNSDNLLNPSNSDKIKLSKKNESSKQEEQREDETITSGQKETINLQENSKRNHIQIHDNNVENIDIPKKKKKRKCKE